MADAHDKKGSGPSFLEILTRHLGNTKEMHVITPAEMGIVEVFCSTETQAILVEALCRIHRRKILKKLDSGDENCWITISYQP